MAVKIKHKGAWVDISGSSSTGTSKIAVLEDQKSSNTNGGTFTSGAWRDRTLNTETDPQSFVTLNGVDNVTFSLEAGTYEIDWSAPATMVDKHQTRLMFATNSEFSSGVGYVYGSSEMVDQNETPNIDCTRSFGRAIKTITQTTYFKIQHRCSTTKADDGFGTPNNFTGDSQVEVYTKVKIQDLATAVKEQDPGTTKAAVLWDEKTSGTDGGSLSPGSWVDRVLNSKTDPQSLITWPGGASTGTDGTNTYFSLVAGTYSIKWSAPGNNIHLFKTQLLYANNSSFTSSTAIQGTSGFDGSAIDPNSQTRSFGETVLTISETTYFKVQQRCTVEQLTYGLGGATGLAVEVYTQLSIVDLATAVKEGSGSGGSGGISGITIKDEGSALSTLATGLDFIGGGVIASGTGATKTINIPGGGVSDGDKGDVIVSGSGTQWLLDVSGVSAGSYTNASITVDAKGRLTTASSGSAGISGITIKDEGSALSTVATTLNFTGAGVEATGTGAEKTITISGGGGGGSSDKIEEGNTSAEVVDTGSDGHFKVLTEGTERLRIIADGKMGLGIDNPQSLLQLHTPSSAKAQQQFTNTATGTGSGDGLLIGLTDDEEAIIWNKEGTDLQFATTNTERLRITSSGAWGLAGTNYGDAGQVLKSQGSSSPPIWDDESGGGSGPTYDFYCTDGGGGGTNPYLRLDPSTGSNDDVQIFGGTNCTVTRNTDTKLTIDVGATDLSNTANGTSLTINSSTGTNTALPAATTSAWGVMTDEDKTNLDANTAKVTNATHTGDVTGATALTIANDKIEEKHINAGGTPDTDKVLVYDAGEATNWRWATQAGGGGGGATNLTNTANGTSLTINSSTGDNTSLPAATTSAWGVMSDEDKTNLDANTAKVTNATHTGDVTGATALTIANDKIEEKHLNVGGTPDTDKVLVYDASATGKWKWADQSGSSTSPTRTTASATTGSLAADASADLSITGFKSYALLKIAINHPAWVVLYTNDTTRTADDSRAEGTDPTPGSGVLAEVITTTAGASTFVMSPGLIGWNDDGTPSTTVYAKVKNKDSSSRAITVTLTLISMES